jgi:hypothetical protein
MMMIYGLSVWSAASIQKDSETALTHPTPPDWKCRPGEAREVVTSYSALEPIAAAPEAGNFQGGVFSSLH